MYQRNPFVPGILVCLLGCTLTAPLFAADVASREDARGLLGAYVGGIRFVDDAADAAGIDSKGHEFGLDMAGKLTFLPKVGKYVSVGGGVALLIVEDDASFKQNVIGPGTGIYGRSAESSITAYAYQFFVRADHRVYRRLYAQGEFGYRSLSLTREIESCVDCREEDVEIDGGGYLGGGVGVLLGKTSLLSLEYLRHLSGDIESQILCAFRGGF